MLEQVLQTRVDQQMAALMGAIRAAVSGSTGLNQGQTALAVVQVPQNAAAQNQNAGGGNAQQNPGGSTTANAGSAGSASQSTAAQSTATQGSAAAQTAGNNQVAANTSASAATQANAAAQAALQASLQSGSQTTQAAAQALVNQVKAQTAAAMAAAVANGTATLKAGSAPQGQAAAVLPNGQPAATTNTASPNTATASTPAAAINNATIPTTSGNQAAQTASASLSQLLNQGTAASNPVRVLIQQTGQSVELPQLKPLPAGTQITLRQAGSAQVDILKVQLPQNQQINQNQTTQNSTNTQPVNSAAQRAALQQTAMTALRESLPVQQPVTETLGRIQSMMPQLSAAARDNPALQQALQVIDKATLKLSTEAAPTGQAVKQSIQRSGVFHEAVLMQALQQAAMPTGTAITPVGDDLKGAFFQIFRQLTRGGRSEGGQDKPSTTGSKVSAEAADGKQANQTQLTRSLQEGLARIRSNQLQSSPATRGAEPAAGAAIQTDLPVAFNGQLSEVKVKIDQEIWPEEQTPEAGEEYKRRWVIDLSFSPPELGNLHARLLYQNEKLKTHLWVEQDDQLPNVSKQLHELKERLMALGIEIEEVRCQSGTPQQQPNPTVLSLKA